MCRHIARVVSARDVAAKEVVVQMGGLVVQEVMRVDVWYILTQEIKKCKNDDQIVIEKLPQKDMRKEVVTGTKVISKEVVQVVIIRVIMTGGDLVLEMGVGHPRCGMGSTFLLISVAKVCLMRDVDERWKMEFVEVMVTKLMVMEKLILMILQRHMRT
jgi:hypothetical protein